MKTDSDQLDASIVLEQLTQALEANGDLTEKERNRLIVLGITSVLTMMMPMQRKINRLEDKNIIMWIEDHPKATAYVTIIAILVAMFIHQISPWVITHLAFITSIKP